MKTTLFKYRKSNKIFFAAVIALTGAALSLLLCTIMSEAGVVKGFLPLWLFVFFTVLDIVLDMLPHTARWKWFKPAVFAGAALIILLLLMISGNISAMK